MVTDVLFDIFVKKVFIEAVKLRVRHDNPPYIAEWKCNVIDMAERAERISLLNGGLL